jgi:hypothetical protein
MNDLNSSISFNKFLFFPSILFLKDSIEEDLLFRLNCVSLSHKSYNMLA